MNTNESYDDNNRLQELGGSDFKLAEGEPNIKGWTVKDQQGRTIGEVDELIFDPQARKVRYIVLDLEGNVLDLEPRDVLVPIGLAELHESEDDVILPNVTAAQLQALPVYREGSLTRDVEASIQKTFAGLGAAGAATGAALSGNREGSTDDFYNSEYYDEDRFYRNRTASAPTTPPEGDTTIPIIEEELHVGKREVEKGGVNVRTRIVERPVEERINLREEHVHVERTPVNRPATEADLNTTQERNIEITEHAEVPVIDKEARVVEEVSIEKEVEEHDETIRDTVRSTDVDVDNLDPDDPRLDPDDPRRKTDL
jgi:uncharacterized protein (TIGR02271 family)